MHLCYDHFLLNFHSPATDGIRNASAIWFKKAKQDYRRLFCNVKRFSERLKSQVSDITPSEALYLWSAASNYR